MLLGELDLNAAPALASLAGVDAAFEATTVGALEAGGAMEAFGAAADVAGAEVAGAELAVEAACPPLAALAVILGLVAGSLEGLKDVMDLGKEMRDLSLRTGETTGSLIVLKEAFRAGGLGAEGLESYFSRLQNAMGGVNEEGNKTEDAFHALGLSVQELKGLDAVAQFEAMQKGFAGIADQATKVQVARNLFGKSGSQLLSVLGNPQALDEARKRAGPLAEMMDKNSASFEKLSDVVGSLKNDFQEFFAGALSKIAPEATTIADALDSIDFVGIGEAVGSLAGVVLKLGEAFVAIAPAVNFVSEALSKIFGSGSTASAGLADKYRGFAKLNSSSQTDEEKSPVSSLQKVGGGGGFSSIDAHLTEARRQSGLLQKIAENTSRAAGGSSAPVHV